MLPIRYFSVRRLVGVAAVGALSLSVSGCGTSGLTDAPLTDSEIRDFLLRSNDFALAADGAGYEAVVSAAGAQREVLVKARADEVDSMGLAQVKADGEVTLSAIRLRISQLEGKTLPEEDARINADLGKVREAFKGDDKQAITTALSTLDSTVSSVEMAVAEREKPVEDPETSPRPGDGNEEGRTEPTYEPPTFADKPQVPSDSGAQGGGQGQAPGGGGSGSVQQPGGTTPDTPSQNPSPQPPAPSAPPEPDPGEPGPGAPENPVEPPEDKPVAQDQP